MKAMYEQKYLKKKCGFFCSITIRLNAIASFSVPYDVCDLVFIVVTYNNYPWKTDIVTKRAFTVQALGFKTRS